MIRRRAVQISALVLWLLAFAVGTCSASRPGEVTPIEVENRCLGYAIATAPTPGALVRLCPEGFGSGSATIGHLLPSGEPRAAEDEPPIRFVHLPYRLAAESRRTLTLPVLAKTFALAERFRPRRAEGPLILRGVLTATVAGGPTLHRKVLLPAIPRG